MGNLLSFIFGQQTTETTTVPTSTRAEAGAGTSCEGDVQSWCFNTAEYARSTNGVIWDRCMCENEMLKDVNDVVAMKDQYIQDVGPTSQAALEREQEALERGDDPERREAIVLGDYDNRSKVPKQGEPGSNTDDPRWTMELTSRVEKQIFVDADRKGAIRRKSKLSHRTHYDGIRGIGVNPHFGEIREVFEFSGRA